MDIEFDKSPNPTITKLPFILTGLGKNSSGKPDSGRNLIKDVHIAATD
jgi:hypothetical protein